MKVKQPLILMIMFVSCITACTQDNSGDILFLRPGYEFPYRVTVPGESWKMPASLVEISGLSYSGDGKLACVQDEKGSIYIFNPETGEIESEISFSAAGDYEGIAIVENDAWVLTSNGTLFKVTDYLKKERPDVIKYPTALSGKNDAEGLAFDPLTKNLLIACKGYPFLEERDGSGFKAIYNFNTETGQLDEKPFLLISLDTVRYYRNYDAMNRLGADIQALLDASKGDKTFQPSGIAIQPVTGNVFILGSVGKLLLVYSRSGEMLAVIKLKPEIFPQPEGICFSPDGRLYISNEGAGSEGTILKFGQKEK